MSHPCRSTPNTAKVGPDDPWFKRRRAVKRLVLEEAAALINEHLVGDEMLYAWAGGLGFGEDAVDSVVDEVIEQLHCQARRNPLVARKVDQ